MNTEQAMKLIQAERDYQQAKWGNNPHHNLEWLALAQEEAGEVSREMIGHWNSGTLSKAARLRFAQELTQYAAVVTAWLEDATFDMDWSELEEIMLARKVQATEAAASKRETGEG